jgi:hypothetical protein
MRLYSVLLNIDHLIGIMQTRCLKRVSRTYITVKIQNFHTLYTDKEVILEYIYLFYINGFRAQLQAAATPQLQQYHAVPEEPESEMYGAANGPRGPAAVQCLASYIVIIII